LDVSEEEVLESTTVILNGESSSSCAQPADVDSDADSENTKSFEVHTLVEFQLQDIVCADENAISCTYTSPVLFVAARGTSHWQRYVVSLIEPLLLLMLLLLVLLVVFNNCSTSTAAL
jgi:hypothetical protein